MGLQYPKTSLLRFVIGLDFNSGFETSCQRIWFAT
jgi:hypothetical protein